MIQTLSNHSLVASSLPVAAIATDTTTNGTGLAWGAYRSVMVVIFGGAITDGTFVFEVQDSDDDSSYTAVADAYLEGTEPTLISTSDNNLTVIGYKGTRKYVRVSVTSTGTTSGGVVSALIICANPYHSPVAR